MKKAVSLLLMVMCVCCYSSSFASTDIYVKFSGISGTSNSTGFTAYSDVYSTGSTTITCNTTTPSNPCPVSSKEFVFNMDVNSTGPILHLRQAQGTVIASVDFVYTLAGSNSASQVYYQVHLENVLVKSISEVASSGGDRPGVQYSLTFDRMAWKYTPYTNTGTAGTSVQGCYNFATSSAGCSANFPF